MMASWRTFPYFPTLVRLCEARSGGAYRGGRAAEIVWLCNSVAASIALDNGDPVQPPNATPCWRKSLRNKISQHDEMTVRAGVDLT
jgi:hypothetical protein